MVLESLATEARDFDRWKGALLGLLRDFFTPVVSKILDVAVNDGMKLDSYIISVLPKLVLLATLPLLEFVLEAVL